MKRSNSRRIRGLLPIDIWRDKAQNGQAVAERFDRYCLTGDAACPKFIPVLFNHDFDRKVGNVVELNPEGGWWVASITIDQTSVSPTTPAGRSNTARSAAAPAGCPSTQGAQPTATLSNTR